MKRSNKIQLLLSVLLLCLFLAPHASYASTSSGVELQVFLEQSEEVLPGRFKIEAVGHLVLPQNTEIEVASNTKAAFDALPIESPGIYKYKIYQIPGSNKNISYDTSCYLVTVSCVRDSKGAINYEVVARREGSSNKEEVVFRNTPHAISDKNTNGPTAQTSDTAVSTQTVLLLFFLSIILLGNRFSKN